MQTFNAHSAIWHGVVQFAGMLWVKVAGSAQLKITTAHGSELVSWCSGARSRREDELARSRQFEQESKPPSALMGIRTQGILAE